MKLTEDIAKDLMRRLRLPVPEGTPTDNSAEAGALAVKLGGTVALKALLPTGRRGKSGLVRLVDASKAEAAAAEIDVGLREYMLRVYNYMASGLTLTGIIAYMSANTPAILSLLYTTSPEGFLQPTMLAWIAMLSPLGFVLALSFGINRMKPSTAQAVFWGFSAVMGLSLAHIFLAYTGASIARVFFITAGTFAGMSLYGYTTKRDLSRFGSFLFMGLIGIILASVVNMFLASSALQFAISVIGVLVFVGLTAYDT